MSGGRSSRAPLRKSRERSCGLEACLTRLGGAPSSGRLRRGGSKTRLPDSLLPLAKQRELLPEKLAIGKAQGLKGFNGDEPFARVIGVLPADFEFRDQLSLAMHLPLVEGDLVIDKREILLQPLAVPHASFFSDAHPKRACPHSVPDRRRRAATRLSSR